MEYEINEISEEELEKQLEEYKQYIQNLKSDELLDKMRNSLIATDVLVEGFNIVTQITEAQGINISGIIKLREAVGEAIDWLNYHLNVEPEIEEENDDL